MNKIKEEFLLSLIFVGKWIALGFAAVGILYFAINLAYHKSYFDPRMAKFDLEIEELAVHQSELRAELSSEQTRIDSIGKEIGSIRSGELTKTNEAIADAKSKISKLGHKWWEKIVRIPAEASEAYKELENAEDRKAKVLFKIDQLEEEQKRAVSNSAELKAKIEQSGIKIQEVSTEKRRAEVDVKGPLLWLAGILGLT